MKNLSKIGIALLFVAWGFSTANAQQSLKEDEARRVAEVKKLVDQNDYVFEAERADFRKHSTPLKYHNFFVAMSKDTLLVCLPLKKSGLVKFDIANQAYYYYKQVNDDGSINISIVPKSTISDVKELKIDVTPEGQASVNVFRKGRGPLSFDGYIKQEDY